MKKRTFKFFVPVVPTLKLLCPVHISKTPVHKNFFSYFYESNMLPKGLRLLLNHPVCMC